jgi:hypothetical protein
VDHLPFEQGRYHFGIEMQFRHDDHVAFHENKKVNGGPFSNPLFTGRLIVCWVNGFPKLLPDFMFVAIQDRKSE